MKKINFSEKDINFIIQKYTSHEMTTLELGNLFNCSRTTIERRLKENGIVLKSFYKYENLIGKQFGNLTVIKEDKERYEKDRQITNKPHRYWFCQCNCGNPKLFTVQSSHLKNGHTISCGCIKSLAQQKIITLLTKNNIKFKKEYSFPDLKGINNGNLRYDFAIFNNDNKLIYLIEYNGKQHYEQNGGWNTQEEFFIRQKNDNIKIQYAKSHNIPFIIIPYTKAPNDITLQDLIYKEI